MDKLPVHTHTHLRVLYTCVLLLFFCQFFTFYYIYNYSYHDHQNTKDLLNQNTEQDESVEDLLVRSKRELGTNRGASSGLGIDKRRRNVAENRPVKTEQKYQLDEQQQQQQTQANGNTNNGYFWINSYSRMNVSQMQK